MTPKQKRFCQEYLVDLNSTAAACRAGYSPNGAGQTAAKLLKNPNIRAELDAAQADHSKRTGTSAEYVIRELVENHYQAKAKGDIGQSNRCLELIGKHHGAFVDRIQTDQTVTVNIIRPARGKVNPA